MSSRGQWTRRTSADLPHPLRQTIRPAAAAAAEVGRGALSLSTRTSEVCTTTHIFECQTYTSSRSASDIVGSTLVDSRLTKWEKRFAEGFPHFVFHTLSVEYTETPLYQRHYLKVGIEVRTSYILLASRFGQYKARSYDTLLYVKKD